MSRRAGALLAVALLAAAALGCGGAESGRRLDLAHGLPTTHPVHHAMVFLGERLGELSGGSLRVDVHPAEQLGTERESLELLQIGSIALTKVSASVLEGFVPVYGVFGLPYLFRSEAHRFAVLDGDVGRRILAAGEPQGLVGLAYYDAGTRSFYTKDRPIRRPEDLAGLKIRTQESPVAIAMVEALGGSATPIAWGELYTSLQQGVVDGAENNPPSFHLSRHYEVCRFYSLDRHTATPDVLLVSARVWRSLSPREQGWLRRAAAESAVLQRRLWREATEHAMQAVAEAGVTILEPDPAAFAAAAAPLLEAHAADPELGPWVSAIRAAGEGS